MPRWQRSLMLLVLPFPVGPWETNKRTLLKQQAPWGLFTSQPQRRALTWAVMLAIALLSPRCSISS